VEVPDHGETFTILHERPGLRVEWIVSSASPDGDEYDQDHDEWVYLVTGSATLDVEGECVELQPGDQVFLPAHRRHRVARTERGTAWLALHFAE
jgi:cupin 2 domain-containing protein